MANMSHCRFTNTLSDLKDCYQALAEEGLDSLSENEKKKALLLIKECRDLYFDFEDEIEEE